MWCETDGDDVARPQRGVKVAFWAPAEAPAGGHAAGPRRHSPPGRGAQKPRSGGGAGGLPEWLNGILRSRKISGTYRFDLGGEGQAYQRWRCIIRDGSDVPWPCLRDLGGERGGRRA